MPERSRMTTSHLQEWSREYTVIYDAAIIICRKGNATIHVDFREWQLTPDAVIILFPNEVVYIPMFSDDFEVEMLSFDKELLREASVQLERTVYSSLRRDRCRGGRAEISTIINNLFASLKFYFREDGCTCLDQIVMLQLKAFFLGFYDYMYRFQSEMPDDVGTTRTRDIFNRFMDALEEHYRQSHDVAYYANLLNISTKYLNNIVKTQVGMTTKTMIDEYVMMQLKLTLRTTEESVKEIATNYHFSDVPFLCRFFKAHTGQTPQQFRKYNKYKA